MPIYTVTLRIVVPGLGTRTVDFPQIAAATMEAAIAEARRSLTAEPVVVTRTGD